MRNKILVLAIFFTSITFLASQEIGEVGQKIFQRYDFRRKIDNVYQGLFYGQIFGQLKRKDTGLFQAHFYFSEESKRDLSLVEKPIQTEGSSTFEVDANGKMINFKGDPVPVFRNFPHRLPADFMRKQTWQDYGELVLDVLSEGKPTRIPILVAYNLKGLSLYNTKDVIEVTAKYALRYKKNQDPLGNEALSEITGTHESQIYFDLKSQLPLFVRTKASEQYNLGGKRVTQDGFYLTFFEGGIPFSETGEGEQFKTDLQDGPIPGVVVTQTDEGLSLRLENLKFYPDRAELLPGEADRLKKIAEALKKIKGKNFLIRGHTADFGDKTAQLKLSKDRALTVLKALTALGLPPGNFLYEGKGSTLPIAPNDTEENMARNRRVEILIMEN